MEPTNKESELSAGEQSTASEVQDTSQTEQLTTQNASTAHAQNRGGPRTQQGKDKSKHNALKHGIFSRVAVLEGEPQTKFDSLLSGLRSDLEPEGTLEEVLVEKLAANLWRHRRLLVVHREISLTGSGISALSLSLAEGPSLEILLRYETNLERAFDRILNQLERQQRIRRGEPVAPTVNVNLST